MQAWPLQRIAHLDFRAFAAIVQSMVQTELGRHNPLAYSAKDPHAFAAMRWEHIGCPDAVLSTLTRQVTAMFHVRMQPPQEREEAGEFVRRTLELWQEGERPISFFTSGSTGTPKACTHLESHVRQTVASLAPLFEDRKSALPAVPLYHSYGFIFGLLLPLSLGIPIRSIPPLPTLVEAQMRHGDLVVGIPLLWSRLVEMKNWQAGRSHVGRDITALTATSPTPPEVMHALCRHDFRTVEIYGSSESCAICYREDPDGPFSLFPHMKRGTGEHQDTFERLLPDGTLIRYPILDAITWFGDRALRPGARLDKAVQVAGVNVYPQHVGSVLRGHEGVSQCVVRLMRPEEGHRLKAFVVPRPGWNERELRQSLARFARKHLDDVQRPARYAFGNDIPRGPTGKAADW